MTTVLPSGIEFTKVRTITVAGFSAEADPNVTPPAAASVYNVPQRATGQGAGDEQVHGFAVKYVFVDNAGAYVAGGTVDYTTWYKDQNLHGFWTSLTPEATAAANRSFIGGIVANVFTQVTALSAPGGGTFLQVWMAPRVAL